MGRTEESTGEVDGGAAEDLIVYRVDAERWFVVPNAANTATACDAMRSVGLAPRPLEDWCFLGVQGPRSRAVIEAAGLGERFFHRTGHGIGLEEHEDPYIVSGNTTPLVPGHAFSIEPGIYVEGLNGARIEDIVLCGERGVDQLNLTSRELYVVAG